MQCVNVFQRGNSRTSENQSVGRIERAMNCTLVLRSRGRSAVSVTDASREGSLPALPAAPSVSPGAVPDWGPSSSHSSGVIRILLVAVGCNVNQTSVSLAEVTRFFELNVDSAISQFSHRRSFQTRFTHTPT